jgi:hypothetical protein
MANWTLNTRYGRLTVLDPNQQGDKVEVYCDCGTIKTVWRNHLTSGQTQSCGCLRDDILKSASWTKQRPKATTQRDGDPEIGDIFGRLTVTGTPQPGHDRTIQCLCTCGNQVNVTIKNLKNHKTFSCGCYRKEGAGKLHTKKNHPNKRI